MNAGADRRGRKSEIRGQKSVQAEGPQQIMLKQHSFLLVKLMSPVKKFQHDARRAEELELYHWAILSMIRAKSVENIMIKDSLRILNLEDNVNDAELNQAMISARWPDCPLVRVDTRSEFLSALEQGGFDVILSDYTMPGFSGLHALELSREKRPEIPFLFVSGTIGEDAAIEALKNGATDYVLKHRLMRLIPAVDRALREARERTEYERAEEAMRQSEHKYRELFES